MGIAGFLQFSLKCVDLFAWPIFALLYPLFASIRAIETNSNYHMRKLVTYWILFSLISLFELSFAKFIEWFPLWSYIKIIAICWLVIPRFSRSYHAYKRLVQLCSYANLQVLINWLNKQVKEHVLKTEETFLSVVEKYIKENGTDALEKLIANKSDSAKPNLDAKAKMAVTITEEKEMATTMESKGAKPDLEEVEAVANTEKREKATTVKLEGAKPEVVEVKVANTEKKEMVAIEVKRANANIAETERRTTEAVKVKQMNTPAPAAAAASGENSSSSSDKVQRHWTCAICQVTTMSEATLNSHLQGKKHTAKCEELKAMKQTPKNKSSSSSTTSKSEQANVVDVNSEGEKPNFDTEEVKVSNAEKKEMAAIEVNRANANLAETERRTAEVVEVNQMNTPAAAAADGGENYSSFSDKVQRHWTCAVCQVTTTSETTLNSHLQGQKHIAKCEELKSMKQTPKNECSSSSTTNKSKQVNQNPNMCVSGDGLNQSKSKQQERNGKLCCGICNVSCCGEIDMASHLKGKKHLSMVQKFVTSFSGVQA